MVHWLTDLASEYGGTYQPSVVSEANASDPRGRVFTEMAAAVKVETGIQAEFEIALGTTDGRHWRRRGVPVAQYGADPLAQGTPGEHVSVTELGEIARVHARTALALLSKKG
jgi:acetylornithine deacetylase/succinyl-diaminopimelate desuccinylase-like protein